VFPSTVCFASVFASTVCVASVFASTVCVASVFPSTECVASVFPKHWPLLLFAHNVNDAFCSLSFSRPSLSSSIQYFPEQFLSEQIPIKSRRWRNHFICLAVRKRQCNATLVCMLLSPVLDVWHRPTFCRLFLRAVVDNTPIPLTCLLTYLGKGWATAARQFEQYFRYKKSKVQWNSFGTSVWFVPRLDSQDWKE